MPATTSLSRSRASEVFTSRCAKRCDHLRPLSPALSPAGRGRCSLRPLSPALSPTGRGRCSPRPLSPALSPTGRGRCSLRPLSPALSPTGRGRCSLRPLSPALSPAGRGKCSPSPQPSPRWGEWAFRLNGSGKWHAEQAWIGRRAENVLIEGEGGRIKSVEEDTFAPHDATMLKGWTMPGFANAHSHAFQRLLRGEMESGGGDFWEWRERMYRYTQWDPADYFKHGRLV